MNDNPFQERPINPYASPAPHVTSGPSGNPLLIPAIFLLIFSSLFIVLIIASLPRQIIQIRAIDTSTPEGAGRRVGQVAALVIWPLINLAIAIGALSMIKLKGYRSAYTAAVLSSIPICSPCYVVGIPFGIWALIVLRRPEIKQRFARS